MHNFFFGGGGGGFPGGFPGGSKFIINKSARRRKGC